LEETTLAHAAAAKNIKNAMDKKLKLILSFIVLFQFSAFAQKGKVEIIETPEIKIENERRINAVDTAQIQGFRIQIYFGSDMYKADEQRNKFIAEHPEYAQQVYRKYERPYWKIRVGNFYREIDAQNLLLVLEKDFDSVFIVKDNIELPPLK
jgi:hypothetical protein